MQLSRSLCKRAGAAVLVLLAALVLLACGSASPSATTATGSKASAAAGSGQKGGFGAMRECLAKQGIKLPQQVPGGKKSPPSGSAAPLGGGGFAGGQLPKGVSRSKFEAAMKKCGGGLRQGTGATGRLKDPTFTKALAKFAECMRSNGVAVANPNTSGSGPIFSTKGLNVKSAKFRAAQSKCSSLLKAARPGGGGTPPQGGESSASPPAGGAPPQGGEGSASPPAGGATPQGAPGSGPEEQ